MQQTTRRVFNADRRRFWGALRLLLALPALLMAVPALAVPSGFSPPTPIALSGMSAPGGGTYNSFDANPVVNSNGQVAFIANMTSGVSNRGLFMGTAGSLQQIARTGLTTPLGDNYDFIISCVLNESGQVAFNSNLSGPAGVGLFVGTPGSVQTVARSGLPAPAGGNYNNLNLGYSYAFNENGSVAFPVTLTGGSSNQGIFTGFPGSLQTAALQGTLAPAGGTYTGFGTAANKVAFNNSGSTAFLANLSGSSNQGIFAGQPGSIQAVALQGSPAPAGGNFGNSVVGAATFLNPAINGSGQIAFSSRLIGGSSSAGLFVGTPGALQTIALQGDASPSGGTFSTFGTYALNGSGQVAFSATVAGGTGQRGVFVGTPTSMELVGVANGPAPGGVFYNNLMIASPVINAAGQVAFTTRITGPGVVPSLTDDALFAGLPGAMFQVVREGDLIDVDPGPGFDYRTVDNNGINVINNDGSGGEDGRGMFLSDNGLLVYRLQFTDNTSGIFTTQLNAVPEPSTFVLGGLALLGFAGAGWRRRRLAKQAV